jgi:hypothetical protein
MSLLTHLPTGHSLPATRNSFCRGSPESSLCLSKYGSVYDQTHAGLCRALRRRLRLLLNLNLDLSLNLAPYPAQNRALFGKSLQQLFRKFFASSFGSLFAWKYRQL